MQSLFGKDVNRDCILAISEEKVDWHIGVIMTRSSKFVNLLGVTRALQSVRVP